MADKHSYTCISDAGVVVCNDCGAYATTDEDIKHHASCVPGDAAKWETYYDEELQEAT